MKVVSLLLVARVTTALQRDFGLGKKQHVRHMKRSAAIIIDNIETTETRAQRIKDRDDLEEELAAARMSPAQEESELTNVIEGTPKIAVSGLFGEARSDQLVLDVLHSQESWGAIVALAPDVASAKKRLMSRSARYSGLLNKLEFVTWDKPKADEMAALLDAEDIEAWLAFDVAPEDVKSCLEAAKASKTVKRVVIGASGAVDDADMDYGDLEWSICAVPGGYVDSTPAFSSLSVDFVDAADAEPVSRDDAMLVAAEAFVLKGSQKKAFSVAYGGENATAYLKSLREAGFSRRAELGKLVEGGLQTWLTQVKNSTDVATKKKEKYDIYDMKTEVTFIKENSPEFAAQLKANEKEAKKAREEEIGKAARIQLKSEYGEKQFTTCRAVTEEEYIRYYWKRAMEQQAQYLGYKKTEDHYESGGPNIAFPEDDYDEDEEDEDDEAAAAAAAAKPPTDAAPAV